MLREQLVREHADTVDRRGFRAKDDRAERDRLAAVTAREIDLRRSEITLRPDEHEDLARRLCPGEHLLDGHRAGLQGSDEHEVVLIVLRKELPEAHGLRDGREPVLAALLGRLNRDALPFFTLAGGLRVVAAHDGPLTEQRCDRRGAEFGRLFHDDLHVLSLWHGLAEREFAFERWRFARLELAQRDRVLLDFHNFHRRLGALPVEDRRAVTGLHSQHVQCVMRLGRVERQLVGIPCVRRDVKAGHGEVRVAYAYDERLRTAEHFLGGRRGTCNAQPPRYSRSPHPMQAALRTITFLFTDIEGSSRLWERFPEAMARALARHDHLMREVCRSHRGEVFKTMGDAFCVAFANVPDAARAALAAQRGLAAENWDETCSIRVRIAMHTGEAEERDGDYFGRTLNRVARLLAAGHGGQTLFSQAAAERVADALPPGVTLRDLGERRLKDLTRPERIYQLVAPDLPSEFPPLRSLEVLPNNLPAQVSSFIGRVEEMAEVKRLLTGTRLLTLTGPGGTGKTRLSIQTAADLLESYPHGVWLVELATLSESSLVPEAIAAVLEVREEGGRPLVETLIDWLRPRRLLLVLDNCEPLVAACAELATALLRRCPELRILASSREPLGIAGESIWPVPSLDVPHFSRTGDDLPDLAGLARLDAVQLFVERAAAVHPAFALTPENAATVARICWRLDGIPLAIELAAARVKLLTPAQILARIDDRFRLLTGGSRSALPRQQTLGALIDWSYDLLSENERALLRRMVVFAGGRTLEMVEEVCAGDGIDASEVFDLLGALVDKSLVMIEPGPDADNRYTLLESVWDYGEQKLASAGETTRYRDRHLDFFVRYAEEAESALNGPKQIECLDRIAAYHYNFRYALRWSVESLDRIERGLRLASALARYWEVRNYLEEARDQFKELLDKADDRVSAAVRARSWLGAGRLAWCQDRGEDALRYYEDARRLFVQIGDRVQAGLVHAMLGFAERNEGRNDAARAHFEQADALAAETGSERLLATAQSGLSSLAADAGEFEKARELKERSLTLFHRLGDLWIVGLISWSLAKVAIATGDHEAALRHLRESVELTAALGNKWSVPYALESFGDIAANEGDATRAARLYGAASALREALGLRLSPAERAPYESALTRIRRSAGDTVFEHEWGAGRSLRAREALEFATGGAVQAPAGGL